MSHLQLVLLSRVDSIAKYIGALREQEKRIKCLESQASQQPNVH